MLEIIIPFTEFSEDEEAVKFVEYLKKNQTELKLDNATLYYRFPLFKEFDEDTKYPEFFIVSDVHGIIIISKDNKSNRLIDEEDLDSMYDNINTIYTYVFSKLMKVPGLRKKKSRTALKIPISTIVYLPNYMEELEEDEENNYWTNNLADFERILSALRSSVLSEEMLTEIYSVIDGTRGMPRPTKREVGEGEEDTKGAVLSNLDLQIAKFDGQQKIAALTIIEGPQRVRGMAGSGKTIILAMKVAMIHLENPHAKILYTFYTKSLYDQIKQLITRFYRMHEDHDPDWDKIHILHAWGGKNLQGVYYNACIDNGVKPLTLNEANYGAKQLKMNSFEFVCFDLLSRLEGNIKKKYDYILMDEGQDFAKTFYWLCRKLVVNDRLVWAYDELQNILDIELQETMDLFKNDFGDEGIDLPNLLDNHPHQNNDIVLHRSYRNPREILLVAHALGFGIYNEKILQILENKEHWQDLGYNVLEGDCRQGEHTVIERPSENSPSIISEFYSQQEIIKTHVAENSNKEVEWVVDSIISDIQEKLLPEDIMIISLDDKFARRYFTELELKLAEKEVFTNNILDSYSGNTFIVPGKVTLTTVYRAKGNEAAMVYVIGADSLSGKNMDIVSRNKLFTAFTRAKGWLRFTGVGTGFKYIIDEIEKANANFPNLIFTYPGLEEIKTLRRELAKKNATMNKKRAELMEQLDRLGIDRDTALSLLKGENQI